jgi:LPS-assembly protein
VSAWKIVVVVLSLHWGGAALALEGGAGLAAGEPVSLEADQLSFDQGSGTYQAAGKVQLQKGSLTLHADRVQWSEVTGEALASGEVEVTEPSGTLTGETLWLNINTDAGRLTSGRAFLRGKNVHLVGKEIERFNAESYRISQGTFTTCNGTPPSWKFGAKRLDVTLGGYARARHVLFYVYDLPVFYLPYLIYPVSAERESGFLMPRFGYSDRRGTELSLGYYQVLGRNMDATFYLDYLSDLGVGKGVEYRYIFGQGNEGNLRGYHISGIKDADDRYALDWQHLGALTERLRLLADVEYVSSSDYFADFGEEAGEYNRDMVESVVALNHNWDRVNLGGQFKYTRNLQGSNDTTLQQLPEVRLDLLRRRLGETPFFSALESSTTYFWRHEGLKGQRLNLRPSLGAVFHPGGYLEIAPEVGYRERFYQTSGDGPGYEEQGLVDFSTRISTRLSRIFAPEGKKVRSIRHIIEPEIFYTYLPNEDQSHLPQFDRWDVIAPRNVLGYALTNRFTARLETEEGGTFYHDFLYLRLSQEYDIRQARLDGPKENNPFSTLRSELILRPTRWSSLDLDLRFDPEGGALAAVGADGAVRDGVGNALAVDYRYRRGELEYIAGTADLAWFKPLYLKYQQRYDFAGSKSLESVAEVEFRAQCWSLYLTYRDRLEDRSYLVSFALSGLGKVDLFGGGIGESGK